MNSFFKILRQVLLRTCILYTALSLGLFLVLTAIPEAGNMIRTVDLLTVFAFALLLACANLILGIEKIVIGLRVLLHYLASGFTYWILFILIAQKASGTGVVANLIFFTIMYALIMGLYLFVHYSLKAGEQPKKDRQNGTGYQSIYKK